MIFNSKQCARREPLHDINPQTGDSIEVFYADRALDSFSRCGPGWFWRSRERGCPPAGPATGPFPTSYSAYRHALGTDLGAKRNTLLDRAVKSEA